MGEPVWDTAFVLSDRTVVGSFLTGLVGYRARPSMLEAVAYFAYLVMAAVLLWGRKPRAGDRARSESPSA